MPDYYGPLEIARTVRDYVGGSFTLFDAMALPPEEFEALYIVAGAINSAARAKAKTPEK